MTPRGDAPAIRAEPLGDSVPFAHEGPTNGGGVILPGQTNDFSRWVTREQMRSAVETGDPTALWYYSGTHGGKSVEGAAKATAEKYGGRTMMMLIEDLDLPTPFYSDYSERAAAFWRRASVGFSEAARGEVRIIFGDAVRRGNTWQRVECPTLMANPRVTAVLWAPPGGLFRKLLDGGQRDPRRQLPDGIAVEEPAPHPPGGAAARRPVPPGDERAERPGTYAPGHHLVTTGPPEGRSTKKSGGPC
ncbi:hypothetical protein ACIP46_01020 [Streptomyces lavendulae]|uniref:hypothetical protein n=1 Tax=Streptomyces lavendulae TaxID=1914 RepID=UPI00382E8EAC